MARYIMITLAFAFIICITQIYAASELGSSTPNTIEEALKSASDSISKAFNDAKPKFDELLVKGQEFLDTVGKKISEEAGKIIPKSNEKAT